MRIISWRRLREFSDKYSDAREPLHAWHQVVERADWKHPVEVRDQFLTADLLPKGRVVFDILRNRYRIVVLIRYDKGIVYVRFVGTHKQYNAINVMEV